MDETQQLFYRLAFREKFFKARGNVFQELFTDLMQYAHKSNFKKVRPYGKEGDLKCDGYLSSHKCVFQCYAPLTLKEANLVKKIEEDFRGAKEHWNDLMDEWIFVHNGYDGLPGRAIQFLERIDAAEDRISVKHWTLDEMLNELDKLSQNDFILFLGQQPTADDIRSVNRQNLETAIKHLTQIQANPEIVIKAPSPQKLFHNNLSKDTQDFLQMGRQRDHAVQVFFETYPNPAVSDSIAESYRSYYKSLKAQNCYPEEIFSRILSYSGFGKGASSSVSAALLTIIAYFFDRCEIFEDPNSKDISS
jgi:hypothetical protein